MLHKFHTTFPNSGPDPDWRVGQQIKMHMCWYLHATA